MKNLKSQVAMEQEKLRIFRTYSNSQVKWRHHIYTGNEFHGDGIGISLRILVNRCQLLLTPLSEITCEDAKQIAEMASSWDRAAPLDADNVSAWLDEVMNGNCAIYADYVSGNHVVQLINKLRKLDYDCDNLINSGIAIRK